MNPSPIAPTYINLEYFFYKILEGIQGIIHFFRTYEVGLILKAVIVGISLIFVAIIIYSIVRILEIQREENDELKHEIAHAMAGVEAAPKNQKWEMILSRADSPTPSEWKVAIIEADAMLDELVDGMGYPGEGLGERLKNADPGLFRTLGSASEAHMIRNRIAHDTLHEELSQREAKRVISLYEIVFREFGIL